MLPFSSKNPEEPFAICSLTEEAAAQAAYNAAKTALQDAQAAYDTAKAAL